MRLGLQDDVRRIRRPASPKGWYLPSVVAGQTEVDCFEFITELRIAGGPLIDVLTAKSLHGSLTDDWAIPRSTEGTIPLLLARWQRDGLPAYAQFDNDNVFQGPHQHAHAVGRVSRMCLQLGVAPVFVPPLEHGMQNTIESFNALWQAKVGSGTAWPVWLSCKHAPIDTSRRIARERKRWLKRLLDARRCPSTSSLTRMRRCMATSSSFAAAMRADTFISLASVSP